MPDTARPRMSVVELDEKAEISEPANDKLDKEKTTLATCMPLWR